MSQHINDIARWIFALAGGVLTILEPTAPYLLICTLLIFADCISAWSLARRAAKTHPDKVHKDAHKFQSHHFGHVLQTLIKSYALIIMAYLIGRHITDSIPIDLAKVAAGAICFWQIWSILENESSCNGARWAKVAQKILVDKTSRHFDIDLSGLCNNTEKDTKAAEKQEEDETR